MKCRICGYELDGTTVFCPMCGSKVEASDIAAMQAPVKETEFSWNTYDFPKPRQMRDIKMEWNGSGVMNDDASEGFIQTDVSPFTSSSRQTVSDAPSFTAVPVGAAAQQPKRDFPKTEKPEPELTLPVWHMPEQKAADDTPLWATQPLWDARNLPKDLQDASMPEGQYFTARGYITTSPLPKTAELKPAEKEVPLPEQNAEPETPQNPYEKSPEKFNTFYRKNDEFQKLLDQEYERAKALRGETATQTTLNSAYTPQPFVEAAELSAFEEMLREGTKTEEELSDNTIAINIDHVHKGLDNLFSVGEFEALEELEDLEKTKVVSKDPEQDAKTVLPNTPAQAPADVTAAVDAMALAESLEKVPEENLKNTLDDILTELKEKDKSLDTVRVRNTIEMRIREIREREAAEKRVAMQQAREAYLNAIDEKNRIAAKPAEPAEKSIETAPVQPEADAEVSAPEAPQDSEAPKETAAAAVEKTEAETPDTSKTKTETTVVPAEETSDYGKMLTEIMKQEPEEPRRERSHWFGKLLIAIIVIIVVLEAIIMGLRYFIPDHEITKIALLGEEMVIDLCKEWYARTAEFITTFIKEYITK